MVALIKKKRKVLFKRVLCFFIVLFVYIDSYAAVISDNDGSAFITKAEFEALKNNFNAQIDTYNESIDTKIDGAIAQYLSGIQFDKTKKFIVYGTATTPWHSVSCNKFYLCTLGNGCWYHSTATPPDENSNYWIFDNVSKKTDLGFGYSYWIRDLHYGTTFFPGNAYSGYVQCDLHQSPVDADPEYFDSDGFIWAGLSSTGAKTTHKISYSKTNHMKWICSGDLSESFKQCISVWQPEFTFYHFLDKGDLEFKIGKVTNGKAYEGQSYGANGDASYLESSKNGVVKLYRKRAGVLTEIKDIKAMPNDAWQTISLNVESGDEIVMRVYGSSYGNTGTYAIFFFSNVITGWEQDTI